MAKREGFSPFIISLLDVLYLEIYNKQHKQLINGKILEQCKLEGIKELQHPSIK